MSAKRFLSILLVIAIVAGGAYFGLSGKAVMAKLNLDAHAAAQAVVWASGIIEADDTRITAELGGRVLEVLADEGDEVDAGELLVRMDTTLIDDQITEAQANVRSAQANLEATLNPVREEEIAIAQANLEKARAARDGAARALQHAINMRDNPLELDAQINEAHAQAEIAGKQIEAAQAQLVMAEAGRDRYQFLASDEDKTRYQVYLRQVEAAQAAIASATTAQQGMQQRLENLQAIREHPVSLTVNVNTARAQLNMAEQTVAIMESELALLQAGPRQEDIEIARAQVALGQAVLEELQVQRNKLALYSPASGIVSLRAIEPGEIAVPERTLLTIDNLDKVTLTLYVPESDIGKVKLGQAVDVYVDAVPGHAFAGVVSNIAAEAEFTPKNVQTQRERVNMAFAVKVDLPNTSHILKPGIPADAHIHLDQSAAAEVLAMLSQIRDEKPLPLPAPSPAVTITPVPSRGTETREANSTTAAVTTPEIKTTSTPRPAVPQATVQAPAPSPTPEAPAPAQPAGQIVFATQDETGKYDLWLSETDGAARLWIGQDIHQPDARGDGLLVVNGTGAGTRETLLTRHVDGSDVQEVSLYANDVSPKWAPDGTRLLFVNEQVGELDVQEYPQKDARRLPIYFEITPLLGRHPAWLDNDHVVYQGCDVWQRGTMCGLYTALVSGGVTPWRIVDDTHATSPAANAGRVAYMADKDGNWDIYLLDGQTPTPARLTADPAADGLPVWSPDGEWIAFLSNRGGSWAVWAMRPQAGEEPVKLFDLNGNPGTDWTNEQLAWLP